MDEQDYITATNLAKVRIALGVVRDLIPEGPIGEADQKMMTAALVRWRNALEVEAEKDSRN